MKNFTLTPPPLLIILATLMFNSANAQCWPAQSDEYWYIGSEYGSTKISGCHRHANYNCHGCVLSYLENGCTPSGPVSTPYTFPNVQGVKGTGSINE